MINCQTMKKRFLTAPVVACLALAATATSHAGVTIMPAAGFNITWDGNDGAFFDQNVPPGGATVPNNAALASNGGIPIAASESAFLPTHSSMTSMYRINSTGC